MLAGGGAHAASLFVNADEWALSNSGFATAGAGNVGQIVNNTVSEFGSTIHAFSTNTLVYGEANLAAAMGLAGATYSTGTGISFDLATLQTYDLIMLGAAPYLTTAPENIVDQYIAGGGNVYLLLGTGVGGAVAEANAWNDFLADYGIQVTAPYAGVNGNIDTSGATDPVLAGIARLYVDNPNGYGLTGNVICCTDSGGRRSLPAGIPTTRPSSRCRRVPCCGSAYLAFWGCVAGSADTRLSKASTGPCQAGSGRL